MAKAKEQSLIVEERLVKTLMSEEEQPHKIPKNWVWVDCTKVFDIVYGKNLPTKELKESGYSVFGANGQIGYYSDYMYETEQVLMSCRGAYSGTINISTPFAFITNNSLVLKCKIDKTSYKFIAYLFQYLDKSKLISGSAQPQVTVQAFDGYYIPFPPLAEQQRIVDHIGSLFEKLDHANELAQNALDTFEIRKAAILHKAFTGELTTKWREENHITSWSSITLEECLENIESGKSYRCIEQPPVDGEIGIVKVSAVTWGEFREDESKTCPKGTTLNEKYLIREGDFLFSRANTIQLVGACVLVENIDKTLMLSDKILRFKFNSNVIPKYILHFLKSKEARRQIESLSSGNQDSMRNIGQASIKKIKVPYPSYSEQQEIVRIIDSLFEKEQRAKELCDVIEKIDLMKKAILARAFRGELGTNDPSEESAVELLKEVLE